jgi:hypothetical protein
VRRRRGALRALCGGTVRRVGGHALNHQCLYLGGHVAVNDLGLGLNLVGVILTVLFLVVRRQFLEEPCDELQVPS